LKLKSKALEVNLADYHVDVAIDAKYSILQEVMSKYYGLMEGLNTFLKELSHPYKNWTFIVTEARKYSLEYFHLLKNHSGGPAAANLLFDIFIQALDETKDEAVKKDSVDNILLFIQKAINDSGSSFKAFQPIIDDAFDRIHSFPDPLFSLFVRSYYGVNRLAQAYLNSTADTGSNSNSLNLLLIKYFNHTYSYWLKEEDPQKWPGAPPQVDLSVSHYESYRAIPDP
jgi:pyruvate,orthophosphate dikinase